MVDYFKVVKQEKYSQIQVEQEKKFTNVVLVALIIIFNDVLI